MLHEVRIENLAVIADLDIRIAPGFTALTGETGAGKSLLLDALALLAGGRAQSDVVRNGAERALVEARLTLHDAAARARLSDEGYGDERDTIVRRVLQADGNHRVYVNGRLATAQLLQDVVAPELEILAQHSQQRLLDGAVQTALLDRAGELGERAAAVAAAFRAWRQAQARIEELTRQGGDRDRELDWLRFQLAEFDRLDPRAGELDEAQARLGALRARAALRAAAAAVREWLVDGDGSAVDRLYSAEAALEQIGRDEPHVAALRSRLRALAGDVKAVARDFGRPGDDDDGENVAALESRVKDLERLARKHGGSLDTALAARTRLLEQREALEHLESALAAATATCDEAERAFRVVAEDLSARRRRVADKLARAIAADLKRLDMPHAAFVVDGFGSGDPAASGIDRVAFLLSANPGEPPRPLKRVASGGELSRVLLAIQTAVGGAVPGGTVVFDEIDAGVGGDTAFTVGARMRALGAQAQVLAVTHTPQVAAHAHQQIHLTKALAAGRARTLAEPLDRAARERELARMLGLRVEATAVEHARTLLDSAALEPT